MPAEASALRCLRPDWPVPARVAAAVSLRSGGVSHAPFASLNLAAHVGDAPQAVQANRRLLRAALQLPTEPLWLAQVHGTTVYLADGLPSGGASASPPRADAAVTTNPGRVLAVLVADCLPVLFARDDATAVAIAHAGWRGLAAGVLEATVAALGGAPARLHAWLGPAIGPEHFEVGEEVRAAFTASEPRAAEAFVANARGRWQADLNRLAHQRLSRLGITAIHGGTRCTFAEAQSFYSYRREQVTGRMAALIWLAA